MVKGRILAGRYKLIHQLGQGGMGSVWYAEHVELGTPAAIKLIDAANAGSADTVARFKREAQAAASLRTANVVQILDYGVDGNTPFIAMEMLEGESLGSRLSRERFLDLPSTARILVQVGKAVSRAHENGIIHRDLKPENIFLARDGEDEVPKVLDFGIAKFTRRAEELGPDTVTGTLLGTPYYMSPEQASGKRAVDHRTDLWTLGVIAFECLLGRRPFDGETIGGLVLAICVDPLPVPSTVADIPPEFDQWFARSTARNPDQRYQNAREQMADLARIAAEFAGTHPQGVGRIAPYAGPPERSPELRPPTESNRGLLETVPANSPLPTGPRLDPASFQTTGGPSSVTLQSGGKPRAQQLRKRLALLAAFAVGTALLGSWLWGSRTPETAAISSSDPRFPGLAQSSPGFPQGSALGTAKGSALGTSSNTVAPSSKSLEVALPTAAVNSADPPALRAQGGPLRLAPLRLEGAKGREGPNHGPAPSASGGALPAPASSAAVRALSPEERLAF